MTSREQALAGLVDELRRQILAERAHVDTKVTAIERSLDRVEGLAGQLTQQILDLRRQLAEKQNVIDALLTTKP